MLGPLPRRYSRRVGAAAILICAVLGVWLSRSVGVPLPVEGLLVGSLVGVVCAFLLVHDFTRRAAADPVRTRSPRAP